MNKKVLAIVLTVTMLLSLAGFAMAEEAIDISGVTLMQDGVLNVGMEIGYPPFEEFAEDGVTPIGYDVDFALALGVPPDGLLQALVAALAQPVAPTRVDSAPCQEVVSAEVDLTRWPILSP